MPSSKTPSTPPEISIGGKAPAFTLKDDHGKTVSLASFKDKKNVVLVFYPGDMTPGCTMQLCAVRDDWKKFTAADTVVFGINHVDGDSHRTFAKKYRFPFPLLIDPGKRASARYGAIKPYFKTTVIKRSVVGIGKDGLIFFLRRGMPKNSDILKAIAAANKAKK